MAATIPLLVAGAWLLGQPELAAAAAAAAAVLVVAAVTVRSRRPTLELGRTLHPARVALGEPCEVHLSIRNVGRRRTPVLALDDDAGVFGRARLGIAPVPVGATRDASYSFPTHRRGLHPVGPLTVDVEDAFGLVRSRRVMDDARTLIVLPRTWTLPSLPHAPGDEPEHGTRALSSTSTVDEEFASLRPYSVGDDIRRIHWRTTARIGEPVVRQYDQPWQRRSTILLDVRTLAATGPGNDSTPGKDSTPGNDSTPGSDPAFERAVSAAASLVVLAATDREMVRLVLTDGSDSGFVPAAESVEELLDRLAATRPDPRASLAGALAGLGARPSGRLVTCTRHLEPGERRGWARHTVGYGMRVLLSTGMPSPGETSDRTDSTLEVTWVDDGPLDRAWTAAVAPATPRERVR